MPRRKSAYSFLILWGFLVENWVSKILKNENFELFLDFFVFFNKSIPKFPQKSTTTTLLSDFKSRSLIKNIFFSTENNFITKNIPIIFWQLSVYYCNIFNLEAEKTFPWDQANGFVQNYLPLFRYYRRLLLEREDMNDGIMNVYLAK